MENIIKIDKYLHDAEHGDFESQFKLGEIYQENNDLKKAFSWYTKSALGGHIEAQHKLGVLYHAGLGIEENLAKAEYWYKQAAEQGLSNAQNSLGCMLLNSGDYSAAVIWIRKAAKQGNINAQYNIANILFEGKYVKKDTNEALSFYIEIMERSGYADIARNPVIDKIVLINNSPI